MIVVGHPAPASFNHALANQIKATWSALGCDVTLHDLLEERFNPLLTAEEARGQPTQDPQVQAHIAELRDSDLLAVVHPNCWGMPPALMKGWIDRVFAPNAAYTFAKGDDQGDAPIGLLRTRAALVINTGNTPVARERAVFGDPLERIWGEGILRSCGVKHVMRSLFGVVATSSDAERQHWLADTAAQAARAVELAAQS
jgi:putative NADPH-quinone reductase